MGQYLYHTFVLEHIGAWNLHQIYLCKLMTLNVSLYVDYMSNW